MQALFIHFSVSWHWKLERLVLQWMWTFDTHTSTGMGRREVPEFKRGRGRPHTNWRNTVNKDLLRMGITWQEAEVAAQNITGVRVWPNASIWM